MRRRVLCGSTHTWSFVGPNLRLNQPSLAILLSLPHTPPCFTKLPSGHSVKTSSFVVFPVATFSSTNPLPAGAGLGPPPVPRALIRRLMSSTVAQLPCCTTGTGTGTGTGAGTGTMGFGGHSAAFATLVTPSQHVTGSQLSAIPILRPSEQVCRSS